jgi:ribonuclease-3
MENTKFKSDPYNFSNVEITQQDILNILENLNIQNYKINNLSLFQQAFVHTSYCEMKDYEEYPKPDNCMPLYKKSYETLEFLGDSFLGCIVTNYLYNRYVRYHNKEEGFLTKLKIRFVCGEQLGFLSKKINLNKFMIISKHIEDNCSGRDNIHILEDIYEAFIGALYLDSGDYHLIETFIISSIEKYIDISDTILNDNNYKDQLLRYFQHNFKVHPKYETIKIDNNFECKIFRKEEEANYVENIYICSGTGNTKKKAEQNSSRNALIHYRVMSE